MNPIGNRPRSHYETLEVSRNASAEVLRAAYKSLIQRYHPDRNPGDAKAAERSAFVVKAYQVLSDPVARAGYDLELQRQSDSLERLNMRGGNLPVSAAPDGNEKKFHWVFWAPAALLALVLGYFGMAIFNTLSVGIKPETVASRRDNPRQEENNIGGDQKALPAGRTIPDFIQDLRVPLAPKGSPEGAAQSEAAHVLSIKTIGLVAGGFDPDKYIELLKSGQAYIGQKLSERLTNADFEMLVNKDGDRYLKQLILDSISEITNTQRLEPGASASKKFATHYGAVEVLLPDAFAVESRQSDQVTVQVHTPR